MGNIQGNFPFFIGISTKTKKEILWEIKKGNLMGNRKSIANQKQISKGHLGFGGIYRKSHRKKEESIAIGNFPRENL